MTFVDNVLRFGLQRERVERVARGSASPTAAAIERLSMYAFEPTGRSDRDGNAIMRRRVGEYRGRMVGAYVGPGCWGTKGAVTGSAYEEPDPVHVDPISQARYDAIGSEHRQTVDTIIEDGAGDTKVERFFGAHGYVLTLEQRVAFRIVDLTTLAKWSGKLAAQDSAPPLAASAKLGRERIERASEAWWTCL